MDYQTRLAVSDDVYKIIRDTGKTVIMITHDMELAKNAGRIITLEDGKIVKDEVNNENIEWINY